MGFEQFSTNIKLLWFIVSRTGLDILISPLKIPEVGHDASTKASKSSKNIMTRLIVYAMLESRRKGVLVNMLDLRSFLWSWKEAI